MSWNIFKYHGKITESMKWKKKKIELEKLIIAIKNISIDITSDRSFMMKRRSFQSSWRMKGKVFSIERDLRSKSRRSGKAIKRRNKKIWRARRRAFKATTEDLGRLGATDEESQDRNQLRDRIYKTMVLVKGKGRRMKEIGATLKKKRRKCVEGKRKEEKEERNRLVITSSLVLVGPQGKKK